MKSIQILSLEEEQKLFTEYNSCQDPELKIKIRNKIVECNVGLVAECCKKFHNLPDALSEGNLGLIQAVEKFDVTRNLKFSTYAFFWINAYLHKYLLNNKSELKFSKTQKNRYVFYNLNKVKNKLEQQNVEVTSEALAKELNVSVADVEFMQAYFKPETSLDLRVSDDLDQYNFVSSDALSPEEMVETAENSQYLAEYIDKFKLKLAPNYCKIFTDTILGDKTFAEVGRELNISRERVRQLNVKITDSFKKFCLYHQLDKCL